MPFIRQFLGIALAFKAAPLGNTLLAQTEEARTTGLADIRSCRSELTIRPVDSAPSQPIQIHEIHFAALDTEFVELTNRGEKVMVLDGWKFTKGVRFTFPEKTILKPNQFLVVQGEKGERLPGALGPFEGKLDNSGERLRLANAEGETVTDVIYQPLPQVRHRRRATTALAWHRLDVARDADDPTNWYLAEPSPGESGLPPSERPEPRESVYQIRHTPESPQPNQPVTVTGWFEGLGNSTSIQFVAWVNGNRFTTQATLPTRKPGRFQLTAKLPALPPGTLVRYGFELSEDQIFPHSTQGISGYWLPAKKSPSTAALPVYQLWLDPQAWQTVQANAHSNEESPVLFIAENKAHRAKVRVRGAWARGWRKKSYKILFADDHEFHDQTRINLNSTWRDIAYIRESLAYAIYRSAGVPASQSQLVRLDVNGRFWGLYAEVEQPEKRFLSKRKLDGSAIYKANSHRNRSDERDLGSLSAFEQEYEKETEKDESYEDLAVFCRALDQSNDEEKFFAENVDLPVYYDYLCATAFIQHWDSYNKNHFFMKSAHSNKWTAIPWDLDRTLGDHWHWHFDAYDISPLHGMRGRESSTGWNRLMDACFRTPKLRRAYLERLQSHLETTFQPIALQKKLESLTKDMENAADLDMKKWGKMQSSDWRAAIEEVEEVIEKRHQFLTKEVTRLLRK